MNKTTTFVGQHIMSQILGLSSKDSLASVFKSTQGNKWYKSIKIWEHYVTMMFGVLSGCTSLREIVMGLEAFGGKLNHLKKRCLPAARWQTLTKTGHQVCLQKYTRVCRVDTG